MFLTLLKKIRLNERFFPPKRLGDYDVKKVSMNQTSEGVARLGAKKNTIISY